MDFWKSFIKKYGSSSLKKGVKGVLGYSPGNMSLYKTALTHRYIKEASAENNERLEYLGDAILSALIADYLKAQGMEVRHIMDANKSEPHPYTAAARIVNGKLSYTVESLL